MTNVFDLDTAILGAVAHSCLDGFWCRDLQKPDHAWLSDEFWTLLGEDPATMPASLSAWRNHILPEDQAAFDTAMADPSQPVDLILRHRNMSGRTIWTRCRGTAVHDGSGTPLQVAGALTDLTDMKQAETTALDRQKQVEAANKELSSVAFSVSHDLKSPANTVHMLIEEVIEMDEGGLSADQRDLLDYAAKSVNNMRGLVDDLVEYSRLVNETLAPGVTELSDAAREATLALKPKLEAVQADIQIGDLPTISGHKSQIRKLFQELIENSIIYRRSDQPCKISIDTRSATPDQIEIQVADNGMGIDPQYFDHIFKMFKRLHRADEIPGTGLGLTLCRRIAYNHGGDITVASIPGQGATFTVSLPRSTE